MKILVTGAKGFVGKSLCAQFHNIHEGKARCYGDVKIDAVYEYDVDGTPEQLDAYCRDCDMVFNLAGVNRANNRTEFMAGNSGFASELLGTLKRHGNRCPVMYASSIQATLQGRFTDSEYGRSKKAGEELFFQYATETGARVLVYRFPNLFGKWGRPDYNSVVATFCHRMARNLPIQVNDPAMELEFVYIDDLVDEMVAALKGKEHRCTFSGLQAMTDPVGRYCAVPVTHRATLGEIVKLLQQFTALPRTLFVPEMPAGSFAKKLYSTYLSYVPAEKSAYPLTMNVDARGSFTEILRSARYGQVSVNVSKPGVTKGQHWHNSKWEMFVVVSGRALVRQRRIDSDEVTEFEVSGEKMEVVTMLPGYTHHITNLSDTDDLVTLMWANEVFDPQRPDTYFETVKP